MNVTIFGFPPSTYVRTVRMACAELGVACEVQPVEFGQASHRALHPFAKMPAANIDGTQLFETVAILHLLDAKVGPRLFGQTPGESAEHLQWCSAAVDYLYPAFVRHVDEDDADCSTELDVLERTLTGRSFIVGSSFGAADLLVAPMIAYAMGQRPALLKDHAALADWFDRVATRDSFTETQT